MIFGYEVPNWIVTIISSAVVSLIVSIVVFSIGVRVGKERSDRGIIRVKYEEIFKHFKDLLASIENRKLRLWSDYKLIDSTYSPYVRASGHDGSINLIPKRLAERFLETETEALIASSKVRKEIEEIHAQAINAAFDGQVDSRKKQGSTYRSRIVSISKFMTMSKSDLVEIIESLEPETYFALDTATERGKTHSLYARDDMMHSSTVRDFLLLLYDECQSEKQLDYAILEEAEDRLRSDLRVLSARIADPHPLRDTVFGSIRDFFK